MESASLISVIVPAYNAQKSIAKCIESLLGQDYAAKEIIIIDDGSTDSTAEICMQYPEIKLLRTSGIGPGAARNLGLNQAAGQYIAFTDADCIAEKTWLTRLHRSLEHNDAGGVGGAQLSPVDDSFLGREIHTLFAEIGFISDYMKDKAQDIETKHNPSCNVMYKKTVLMRTGGFRSDMWPGEDTDLDRRIILAGYRLIHNPEAIVYHYRPDSISKLYRMMLSYGGAQATLVKTHGFFRNIQFIPLLFFPGILLEILFFQLSVSLFIWINASALVLVYLFFLVKSKSITKSILHMFLFYIILFSWLLGFYKNMIGFHNDPQLFRLNRNI